MILPAWQLVIRSMSSARIFDLCLFSWARFFDTCLSGVRLSSLLADLRGVYRFRGERFTAPIVPLGGVWRSMR